LEFDLPEGCSLREHQIEALEASRKKLFEENIYRQLVVLPTGSGKAALFPLLFQVYERVVKGRKAFLLVHRKELIHQLKREFNFWNPELKVSIEQDSNYADLDSDVILASIQTVGKKNSARLQRFNPNDFWAVFLDESHRGISKSYMNVYAYFGFFEEKDEEFIRKENNKLFFGVTATPQRSDYGSLETVFDEIIYYKNIRDLIKNNYLVPIKAYSISTDVNISDIGSQAGDFKIEDLSRRVNTPGRNQTIVDSWKLYGENRKTAAFTVDVKHAYDLRDKFRENGISAETIDGTTKDKEREDILRRFRLGEIKVLTNCYIFVEGWDVRELSCIIMARPTRSSLVFTQVTGRGTRLLCDNQGNLLRDHLGEPLKKDMILIDCVDNCKKNTLFSVAELFGLAKDYRIPQGADPLEEVEKFEEIVQNFPSVQCDDIYSLEELKERIKEVDVFSLPDPLSDPAVVNYSKHLWIKLPGGKYQISLNKENKIFMTINLLGHWDIESENKGVRKLICSKPELKEAFETADNIIELRFPNESKLYHKESTWRKNNSPATKKQTDYLKKMKIPVKKEVTKDQASLLIQKAIILGIDQTVRRIIPHWLEKSKAKVSKKRLLDSDDEIS
jgi:ATP-dependent helicase IRC3